MAMVITSDNDRETMVLKYAFMVTVLLISALVMAGCTGSSPAPVTAPTPLTVVATVPGTPAPAPATVTALTPLTVVATVPGTPAPAAPATARATLPTPTPDNNYWRTYNFESTGDFTPPFTTDNDGTWTFQMNYPGNGDFTVRLQDDHGDTIAVLADTRGSYTGTQSLWLEAGSYTLDVSAGSPWTIRMSTG
jgi:hypothetical protein